MYGLPQAICLTRDLSNIQRPPVGLCLQLPMNTRQVLFVALVAMAVAPALGGDALKSKLEALAADKPAATLAHPLPLPTATAAAESKTLVFGTAVAADTNKVPSVATSEAPHVSNPPCKQICKNVCKIDMVKECKTVPVVTKVCTNTTKTLSKQVCTKNCTQKYEHPKFSKKLPDYMPSYPNPSTPPSDVVNAAASAGRRLSGLIAAELAVKAAVAAEIMKKKMPKPVCEDVCKTVYYEVPDVECHDVTTDTEVCKMVPVKNCHEECECKPSKPYAAVKMAKKTPDASVNEP